MRALWRKSRELREPPDSLSVAQKAFWDWGPMQFPEAAWSARQAMVPTGLSHRGARRVLAQLEQLGLVVRHGS